MREAAAVALAVLALAAGARAASLVVVEPSEVEGLFADRRNLSLRFEIVATTLAPAAAALPALGTEALPVEITEAATPATTGVGAGNWTYTATVLEREAESVAEGRYVVELLLDDLPMGAVHLAQNASDPLLREGARVTFDLGAARPGASLFVVSVTKLEPPAVYRLRTVAGVPEPRWLGVGGSIANQVNPALGVTLGNRLTVDAENGDNGLHNLLFRDAGGAVLAGPTADFAQLGEEVRLEWSPGATGTYYYQCGWHETMFGEIQVTV